MLNVTVFVDGPKVNEVASLVKEVHSVACVERGFKALNVIQRQSNLGLSKSIILGVSEVFNQAEHVIVLEDDLLVSEYFLDFMISGLKKFANNKNVSSVQGYCYPINMGNEPFFLRGADCWGWATWKNRWSEANWDSGQLLSEIKSRKLESDFNLDGSYDYLKMLYPRHLMFLLMFHYRI